MSITYPYNILGFITVNLTIGIIFLVLLYIVIYTLYIIYIIGRNTVTVNRITEYTGAINIGSIGP